MSRRRPPLTAWACVELLEVNRADLCKPGDSLDGVLAKGDVRRLMLATPHRSWRRRGYLTMPLLFQMIWLRIRVRALLWRIRWRMLQCG